MYIVLKIQIYQKSGKFEVENPRVRDWLWVYTYRRDSTMAALLFSIVAVFFFCHSTKIITNVYEAVQVTPRFQISWFSFLCFFFFYYIITFFFLIFTCLSFHDIYLKKYLYFWKKKKVVEEAMWFETVYFYWFFLQFNN